VLFLHDTLNKGCGKMIPVSKLRSLTTEIIKRAGFPADDAELIADSLIQADLNGVSTHGLSRLNLYIERAENNALNKTPDVKVLNETPSTVLLDADNGMGIVASNQAIKIIFEKAKSTGIGMASIRNSNHLGALAYVTKKIQEHGFIGFACTNTSPIMAPYGGRAPVLGNNPFSVAIPYDPPIILDTALSVTARGNIILAEREGKPIPEGWAVNDKGQVTTNAKEALLGAVLPMAHHKGYGMAFLIEVLCGVLSGAQYGTNLGSFVPPDFSRPLGFGHMIMAINIESFMDKKEFTQRLEDLTKMVKESPLAEGFSEILLPGEIEHRRNVKAEDEGLELKDSTLQLLKGLVSKYNIENGAELL
jgi:LDH2 family malate/lactate/ureidoglycolate dehydrogenase